MAKQVEVVYEVAGQGDINLEDLAARIADEAKEHGISTPTWRVSSKGSEPWAHGTLTFTCECDESEYLLNVQTELAKAVQKVGSETSTRWLLKAVNS